MPRWVRAVADKHGSLPAPGSGGRLPKFACVGYCFGAPYVCEQLALGGDGDGVVSAGAFAHPAFLKESHFRNLQSQYPLFHAAEYSVIPLVLVAGC